MKIKVDKALFIKSWSLAEKSAGASSSVNVFSAIRMNAGDENVELQATDIKTSIICRAHGVTVEEPGEVVIPLKGVTDLFKKIGSNEFTLQITDGKAVLKAGKNRYTFTTFPVSDFPKLPTSKSARLFCVIKAADLLVALDRGSLCASMADEYPQYLSSPLLEVENGTMNVVSTDNRRLALAKTAVEQSEEPTSLLLPIKGLKELEKILAMLDAEAEIKVLYDEAQAYFSTEGMEYAVRRVESKFPNYTRIIPQGHTSQVDVDRAELLSSIERVDVVVRDYVRTVMMKLTDGNCRLTGRAPEFGEAVENIACDLTGDPLLIGFNTRFFIDAVKVLDSEKVTLLFNGPDGHMEVRGKDSDQFLCLIAPLELSSEELESFDQANDGGDAI